MTEIPQTGTLLVCIARLSDRAITEFGRYAAKRLSICESVSVDHCEPQQLHNSDCQLEVFREKFVPHVILMTY